MPDQMIRNEIRSTVWGQTKELERYADFNGHKIEIKEIHGAPNQLEIKAIPLGSGHPRYFNLKLSEVM